MGRQPSITLYSTYTLCTEEEAAKDIHVVSTKQHEKLYKPCIILNDLLRHYSK